MDGFLFKIERCTESEALEILRDKSVLKFLSVYPVGIKDVETWKLKGALVIIMPAGDVAEVHIACKYRDRAHIGNLFKDGLRWLKARGFKQVFTTAPDHRKALTKMLENLGFEKQNDRWVVWV